MLFIDLAWRLLYVVCWFNNKQQTKKDKNMSTKTIRQFAVGYHNKALRKAKLWCLRGNDYSLDAGSSIKAGSIIKGKQGFCLAHCDVAGVKADVVSYERNATLVRCGKEFAGMVDKAGLAKGGRGGLYAVAQVNGKLAQAELFYIGKHQTASQVYKLKSVD